MNRGRYPKGNIISDMQKAEKLPVIDLPQKVFPKRQTFRNQETQTYNVCHCIRKELKTTATTERERSVFKTIKQGSSIIQNLLNQNRDEDLSKKITTFDLTNESSSFPNVKKENPAGYVSPYKWVKQFDMMHPYPMRSSLFPNVPPYLIFTTSKERTMRPPKRIRKLLYWKTSESIPTIVEEIAKNSGFRLTENKDLWLSTWGRQVPKYGFREFKENQKVNHFPGTFHLGRKDRLWMNITKMRTINERREFSFMPETYLLPGNKEKLRAAWYEAGIHSTWIIKPPASARGEGIRVVQRWSDIPETDHVIVQRYITQPYLINGSKFDLRLYILVTSFEPLRLYVYEEGLVRFASEKYSISFRHLGENYVHLTNYSINCTNLNYIINDDEQITQGHKWNLKCLWSYFYKNGIDDKKIWSSLIDIIIKTIISCEYPIAKQVKRYAKNRYCCYELFGFDIILDHSLKPWLLEVNVTPSLHTDSNLDFKIKSELVRDMFNIIGLHLPEELELSSCLQRKMFKVTGISPQNIYSWNKHFYTFFINEDDKAKQSKFSNNAPNHSFILEKLTPADIKQLVHSEDELARCGRFVRIFPTRSSSFYLTFFVKPKYYNLLLDAWENKYHRNREKGIQLLKQFCEQNIHLEPVECTEENKQESVTIEETETI